MTERSEYLMAEMKELNPEAKMVTGFDDCIVGICNTFQGAIFLYDENLIVEQLRNKEGMSEEEAWEWYDYNILNAYLGDYMPVYLTTTD